MEIKTIGIYVICIITIIIIGKIFIVPLKCVLRLLLNSVIGIGLLYIVNTIGVSFKFHIGINFITAIITGVLGVPGVILLIVITIFN